VFFKLFHLFCFVLLNFCFFWGWYKLLSTGRSGLSRSEKALAALIFLFAQVIFLANCLALTDRLYDLYLLALSSITSILIYLRNFYVSRADKPRRHIPPKQPEALLGPGNLVLLLVLAAALGLVFVRGAIFADVSTDGMWLHIPQVFFLHQNHGLAASGLYFIDLYPKNLHLWYFWILSFFGDARWLDLGQMPFLLLFVLATYCLGIRAHLPKKFALLGALLSCFAPVVFAQINTTHIDLGVSALFVSGFALLLCWREKRSTALLIAAGVAIGLLLGSKYSAVPLVCLLCSFHAYDLYRLKLLRPEKASLALVLTLTLLFGASQYWRNWLFEANPFAPYRLSLGPIHFDGPLTSADVWVMKEAQSLPWLERIVKSWTDVEQAGYGYLYGGFGVIWVIFLSAISFWLLIAVIKRESAFLEILLVFALAFTFTPLQFSTRFTIYLLAIGGISFARLLQYFSSNASLRVILFSLATLCAVYTTFQNMVLFRYQFPLLGHAAIDSCELGGFPAEDRAGFKWVLENVKANQKLLAYIKLEPISLVCLWNPARTSFLALNSTPESAKARDDVDYIFLDRSRSDALEIEAKFSPDKIILKRSNFLLARTQ